MGRQGTSSTSDSTSKQRAVATAPRRDGPPQIGWATGGLNGDSRQELLDQNQPDPQDNQQESTGPEPEETNQSPSTSLAESSRPDGSGPVDRPSSEGGRQARIAGLLGRARRFREQQMELQEIKSNLREETARLKEHLRHYQAN